jgi:hypothetical protein
MAKRKQRILTEEEMQAKRDKNAASARNYNAKGRAAKHALEQILKFNPKILAMVYENLTPMVREELDRCYPAMAVKYQEYQAFKQLDLAAGIPIEEVPLMQPAHHAKHVVNSFSFAPDTHGQEVMGELRTVLAKRGVKT